MVVCADLMLDPPVDSAIKLVQLVLHDDCIPDERNQVTKDDRRKLHRIEQQHGRDYSVDDILKEYPHLTRNKLFEVLRFAKRVHESIKYEKVKASED